MLVFVALYLLMSRIALPRIGSILEDRRQRIEADLAAAQRLKDESDAAIAAYEKALADARGRAQTLANETRAEGGGRRRGAPQGGGRQAQRPHRRGREDHRRIAVEAAMTNVRGIATEAAAAIVERLTGTAPASPDVAAAVGDVLKR